MTAEPAETAERLFVAVEVPEAVRRPLDAALAPLRRRVPGARWVPAARWHLTVAFLGSVAVARRPAVEAAVAAAADRSAAFALALTGELGRFGARVLYAALAPSPELDRLAAAVRAELAARALPTDDRPFRAHLTVARAPGRGRLPTGATGEAADLPALTWPVRDVALVRSRLGSGGAAYTALGRWPLRGRGANPAAR